MIYAKHIFDEPIGYCFLTQLLGTSVREVWGSIPGPLKSDALCHRCDLSS